MYVSVCHVSVGMLKWNPHPKKENIKKSPSLFVVPHCSLALALTLIIPCALLLHLLTATLSLFLSNFHVQHGKKHSTKPVKI